MKLYEHPDFIQAILAASNHFKDVGLRPSIIEKDYYVTEVLRILASLGGNKIIFKGGTSLSKGWNLIQRFSEDIDIFLDPTAFSPPLGANGINRELKKLRDAIAQHSALIHLSKESKTLGGFGRNDRFSYTQHFGGVGEISDRLLVEAGTASGNQPTQVVLLRSWVGQFLLESGNRLNCEDEEGFLMKLLHFRRTFVEKMFAIHSKVEKFKKEGYPIGKYARHYYDLYQLALQSEVREMLQSYEYGEIKADYERITLMNFSRDYQKPDGMSFAESDALFPPPALSHILQKNYDQECAALCYGNYPSWESVLSCFQELRPLL